MTTVREGGWTGGQSSLEQCPVVPSHQLSGPWTPKSDHRSGAWELEEGPEL